MHGRASAFCEEKGYFATLGVDFRSSTDDIAKAYKIKAFKLHPDRNPSPEAAEEFHRIATSFQVLSDDVKRRNYYRLFVLRCYMSQGPLPGLVRSQVRFVWKLHPDVAYTCNWADLFRKYDRDQPHTDMLPEARQHESDWTSVHTRDSGQRGIIGNLHEAFPDGDMWGGFQFFTRFSLRLALAVEFHASNVDSMDERLVPTLCGHDIPHAAPAGDAASKPGLPTCQPTTSTAQGPRT